MASINAEVKRWGNSLSVIIPRETVKKLHLVEGEEIGLEVFPKRKASGFGIAKGAKSFERELEEREPS